MIERKMYKVPELAERWGISRSAIYRLIYKGLLPFKKLGGSVRFRLEDIERIERTGTRPGKVPKPLKPKVEQAPATALIAAAPSLKLPAIPIPVPVLNGGEIQGRTRKVCCLLPKGAPPVVSRRKHHSCRKRQKGLQ